MTLNASSTPPTTGFSQLDFLPGQPLYVFGCQSVSAFNVATNTFTGGTFPAALGPTAASTTTPNSLTVSFAWPLTGTITPGTSDSGGYCTISNFQGGPQQFQMKHLTWDTTSAHALNSANDKIQTNGPNYQWTAALEEDLILGPWFNNDLGEGCSTVNFNYDPNSLTDDQLLFIANNSSLYAGCSYGNNPVYPVVSPQFFFPTTAYCSGATATPACVGFTGAMSASAMPLTFSDYHQFALVPSSSYNLGSDGLPLGD